ncbi:MAG TPA: DUF6365 family protein [Vicinamibacteria bacterium]|nr:DUF6365 family protein [Vicinamibacteria bacterium]
MSETHLFLAAPAAAFGEVSTGLRIARELVAQGDRVVFLAGADVGVLFEGSGVVHQAIDAEVLSLARLVSRVLARERCASVTLVDVASVYLTLDPIGVDLDFLQGLAVPVIALDFWNLRRAGPEWDFGRDATPIPPAALAFERRLLPVPIARPDAGPGVFGAIPERTARPEVGAAVRAELGLGDRDRLVLWPTSRWQQPELQNWKHHARLARQVPAWIADTLARLGERVHLLHVGPQPSPAWSRWGERYRFAGQVRADRLHDLMDAADLLLSLNTTATTALAATAIGVPTVVVANSYAGSAEELAALVPDASPALRAWLADAAPLHPFRLWPLGLFSFLTPILQDNPFTDTFRQVELLDEHAIEETCRALLFDEGEASAARDLQSRYRERIRSLPGPAQAFRACL